MSNNFDLGDYVQVKDRLAEFWRTYPHGRIDVTPPEGLTMDGRWFIGATARVWRDAGQEHPDSVGSAWEPFPGRTPYTKDSEAMNAETSAIGRALGNMGIGILGSVATAEEVRNRQAEREPIGHDDRAHINGRIETLADVDKKRLRDEWKARRIQKLEALTVGDLDQVVALLDEIEAGPVDA